MAGSASAHLLLPMWRWLKWLGWQASAKVMDVAAMVRKNVDTIASSAQEAMGKLAGFSTYLNNLEKVPGSPEQNTELQKWVDCDGTAELYSLLKKEKDAVNSKVPQAFARVQPLLGHLGPDMAKNVEQTISSMQEPFSQHQELFTKAGLMLGNLTAVQSMIRDLKPGEGPWLLNVDFVWGSRVSPVSPTPASRPSVGWGLGRRDLQ
eukprot:11100470-Alexandrium_andersonii.AAC.1